MAPALGPMAALVLGFPSPCLVHSRCQGWGGQVKPLLHRWECVLFSPTCFYSSPLGWGEEVGLDLFSELCLMSVSMLQLHFCFQ